MNFKNLHVSPLEMITEAKYLELVTRPDSFIEVILTTTNMTYHHIWSGTHFQLLGLRRNPTMGN